MKTELHKPQVIRSDDRGDFIQVTQGEFRQLSVIALNKNAKRGRHYHKVTREAFYLYSGKVHVDNFNVNSHEKEVLTVEPHTYFVIEPNLYHTLTALEDSLLIVLPDKAFDPKDEDIYYLSEDTLKKFHLD